MNDNLINEIYNSLRKKKNIKIIILEKDIDNNIVSIKKINHEVEDNLITKDFLIEFLNKLSSKNIIIKYILKFSLNKNMSELVNDENLNDENLNNYIEIFNYIENIDFENENNFNDYDCLIFITQKKENYKYIKL
jgi:hypothetical protein